MPSVVTVEDDVPLSSVVTMRLWLVDVSVELDVPVLVTTVRKTPVSVSAVVVVSTLDVEPKVPSMSITTDKAPSMTVWSSENVPDVVDSDSSVSEDVPPIALPAEVNVWVVSVVEVVAAVRPPWTEVSVTVSVSSDEPDDVNWPVRSLPAEVEVDVPSMVLTWVVDAPSAGSAAAFSVCVVVVDEAFEASVE